jgi:hypothetical protein
MAIVASRSPAVLSWSDYTPVAHLVDPADGGVMDAYTTFNYATPAGWAQFGGQVGFADGQTVSITPRCRVRSGAAQTAPLLAHEQFHYDVGFVIARVVAKALARLRAPDLAQLAASQNDVIRLHFIVRAGLIQRRYDLDTGHGANARHQSHYLRLMTACLANPNAVQIGGWRL